MLADIKNLALKLQAHGLILGTAESCTGGLLAAMLTEIPGASCWFDHACITYSNQAKQQLLQVSEYILNTYGAVSEECVLAMLKGLLAQNVSIGVAISGIAGPEGGSQKKPVGVVWFAFGMKTQKPITFIKTFSGSRTTIRKQACKFAIEQLIRMVE